MEKLDLDALLTLEEYHRQRPDFRASVLAHKSHRQVAVGPHATLYFEDRLTIQYQIQEMLRVERIFESEAIQEELDAYNPLIPDGSNLKATFMLEYEDPNERQQALARLGGIEDRVWIRVAGFDPVFAIADEDIERSREAKTSAVHFMRFEFDAEMVQAAKNGAAIGIGINHDNYAYQIEALDESAQNALVADFA